jgi:hypothetical protein
MQKNVGAYCPYQRLEQKPVELTCKGFFRLVDCDVVPRAHQGEDSEFRRILADVLSRRLWKQQLPVQDNSVQMHLHGAKTFPETWARCFSESQTLWVDLMAASHSGYHCANYAQSLTCHLGEEDPEVDVALRRGIASGVAACKNDALDGIAKLLDQFVCESTSSFLSGHNAHDANLAPASVSGDTCSSCHFGLKGVEP